LSSTQTDSPSKIPGGKPPVVSVRGKERSPRHTRIASAGSPLLLKADLERVGEISARTKQARFSSLITTESEASQILQTMQKHNISKEQLQVYRELLTETLNNADKAKILIDYARTVGQGELTLIVAWQTLTQFTDVVLKSKAPIHMLKTSAESMWEAVCQAVVIPTEICQILQTKIGSGTLDANIFELPRHYIETLMALLIVPSYAAKFNIPLQKYRVETKKDKSFKKLAPRVSSRVKRGTSRKKSAQISMIEKRSKKNG